MSISIAALLDVAPWSSLGLGAEQLLTESWVQYTVDFVCPSNTSTGKLSFYFGDVPSGGSVWINAPRLVGAEVVLPVMRRNFECGVARLNGDTVPRTFDLAGESLRRLAGQQAPRHQYVVDDNSTWFAVEAGQWAAKSFDSGYVMEHSTQEQVRPPAGFAHHWGVGAHQASTSGGAVSAVFTLAVPEAGLYNIKLWWPGSDPAIRAAWAETMLVTIVPSAPRSGAPRSALSSAAPPPRSPAGPATSSLDLRSLGGDEWVVVASSVELESGSKLRVECPAGVGDCIADAVLVESVARWNDGSAATSVTLQAFDAIILRNGNATCWGG